MTEQRAAERLEPDLGFIRDIKARGGDAVKRCFQCATCSVVCPISPSSSPFPRKEMIWAAWGLRDRLISDPDVWLCHGCNECSVGCPRGANPGDVLAAVRKVVIERYATPRFMGRAAASPRALPLLLAPPVLALAAILRWGHGYDAAFPAAMRHDSWFGHAVPLLALETLFVATSIAVIATAFVGMRRFWRDLVAALPGAPSIGLGHAVRRAAAEIALHSRFGECAPASPRRLHHQLTFWGTLALFATTTLVFLGLYAAPALLGAELLLPLSLGNPIKLLGALGGIALCAGLLLRLGSRSRDPEAEGATTYQDSLLLWSLLVVGLSGLAAAMLRMASPDPVDAAALVNTVSPVPTAAVAVYFVHLVAVWFLMISLPYSKLAHMLYRTLALVRAHQVDRWRPTTSADEPGTPAVAGGDTEAALGPGGAGGAAP
jgi:quinone-modifying oxidoreductase subunit QmoC